MPTELQWFSVRLALVGSPKDEIHRVVADLQEELKARPHLRNPRVYWDGEKDRTLVDVEDQGVEPDRVMKSLLEEVFEATCAVLEHYEEFRVEPIGVYPVGDSAP